jgi:thiamine-monophosphate kinase
LIWPVAELDFIAGLRALATHPAARGLLDDAAVLDVGGKRLVLTHDTLVEGVHFLPSDPPETVAWKLLAVNLSDLAAKGAIPLGVLMGYSLTGDEDWDAAFLRGFGEALVHFDVPLLGGDTVSAKERSVSLTAIGEASGNVPSRSGAREGDAMFVTGVIGDAGQGLRLLIDGLAGVDALIKAYRQPEPQLGAGLVLASQVTAMMDVSDGLLIDASRLAHASDCAALIDLDAIPLSDAFRALAGNDLPARLAAATAGDDYQLLFTSSLPLPNIPCPVTRIGKMVRGSGVQLMSENRPVPLPETLGWLHA